MTGLPKNPTRRASDDDHSIRSRQSILSAIAGLVALAGLIAGLHGFLIDGLEGLALTVLLGEDTEYAAGYSDTRWRQVRPGMTRSEVRALLGEPLSQWPISGGTGERWTRSPGDTHYRCRVVIYDGDLVTRKHAEFYVD